jgi:hypothetical protein
VILEFLKLTIHPEHEQSNQSKKLIVLGLCVFHLYRACIKKERFQDESVTTEAGRLRGSGAGTGARSCWWSHSMNKKWSYMLRRAQLDGGTVYCTKRLTQHQGSPPTLYLLYLLTSPIYNPSHSLIPSKQTSPIQCNCTQKLIIVTTRLLFL